MGFALWKAVGDELIFELVVSDESEVSRAVRVWLEAMDQYERQSLAERSLALKGSAFIATFPGPDSESTIPRTPLVEVSDEPPVILNDKALSGKRAVTKFLYDYFGPSIDTGFRVSSLASRRYFTMSVEVSWALACAAVSAASSKTHEDVHHTHDFAFNGSHLLKGVWGGREYPVFAVDRDRADRVNEALERMNGGQLDSQQIIDVCHACSESPGWPSTVYLPQSSNQAFLAKPEDAMAQLRDTAGNHEGAETVPTNGGEEVDQDSLPLG